MKGESNTVIAAGMIIVISFIFGILLYQVMPPEMASHWNVEGQVDDYMPKFWGLFLMPILSAFLLLIFWVIPKIDPLKKNIKMFMNYYEGFVLLMIIFMFYIHMLSIFWNFGYKIDIGRLMMPALGILFFYAGVMIKHAKRNWFIGIRTPWTLSDEKVWDETHKMGAILFKVAGVIVFLGVFLSGDLAFSLLILVVLAALVPVIYSYFDYKKRHSNLKNPKKR